MECSWMLCLVVGSMGTLGAPRTLVRQDTGWGCRPQGRFHEQGVKSRLHHSARHLDPFFIGEWRLVQLCSPRAPIIHESVHQSGESVAVTSFEVVRHLVDHDVFQAVGVLFGEFDVEPDVSAFPVARSPFFSCAGHSSEVLRALTRSSTWQSDQGGLFEVAGGTSDRATCVAVPCPFLPARRARAARRRSRNGHAPDARRS